MDLTPKILEWKKLRLELDEIQATIDVIEDTIKAEMTTLGIHEMVVDIFKVRWIPVTTTRIDTKALKNDLPDVATRYSKTTESRRFTIV